MIAIVIFIYTWMSSFAFSSAPWVNICDISAIVLPELETLESVFTQPLNTLQESDKGQIFYWSIQTCSRIMRLFVDCRLWPCSKTSKLPFSDFFDLTPKYFLPLLPYTDLVPPSTDPVPPSTNQYRPKLTQCHHVSTITALYWSSTTKYQQVSPHTDPVPSCIN